ncbi:MAG: hypothetical protein GY710_10415 [Desulfobacteraceae bacterium]|nr:hypothetical protein [Desulfobacteraceae bacterium]
MIGSVIGILYTLFSLNLYHFYLYFYCVGFFSLINSLIPWGEIDFEKISLYYWSGLKRKAVTFYWNQIESVGFIKEKKKVQGGARIGLPIEVEKKVFCIKMKEDYKNTDQLCDATNKDSFYYDDQNKNFIVYQKPENGFLSLIFHAQKFTNIL